MNYYDMIIWTINLVICLIPPLYTLWFFISGHYCTEDRLINVGLSVFCLAFCWNITAILAIQPDSLQWDYTIGRGIHLAAFIFFIQVIKHCHPDRVFHRRRITDNPLKTENKS